MPNNNTNNKLSEDELKFWNYAFEDLDKALERIPKDNRNDYFKKLYYHNIDYDEIKKEVLKAASFGHNIIIQGSAGNGKTTLMKRYLLDDDFQRKKYIPLYISSTNDNKLIGYIIVFIEKMMKYIEEVKSYIKLPEKFNPENIFNEDTAKSALYYLRNLIKDLDIPSRDFRPLILFDDLDYAEKEWKKIINFLRDFISDSNITFVFTLRPRLENIILRGPDDRFRYLFYNSEKSIMIIPNILEIILNRIHLIIKPEKVEDKFYRTGYSMWGRIHNYFHSFEHKKRKNIYKNFLNDLGINNIDSLEDKIQFPFQEAYLEFMKKVTGNNLRRIFKIAQSTFLYLRENKSNKIEINKNGYWEIDKNSIKKLFMVKPEPKRNSKANTAKITEKKENKEWEFLNINEKQEKKVSLYYAILHILHDEPEDEIQDERSYKIIKKKLKDYKIEDIKKACKTLAERELALIDFIGYYDKNENNNKYRLNKKGLYYLEIANWKQYKEIYGNHNYLFRKN